jgi:hypothetical protein
MCQLYLGFSYVPRSCVCIYRAARSHPAQGAAPCSNTKRMDKGRPIHAHRGWAASLLADARSPIRDRLGSLTGELNQYLGGLLAETGHLEQARVELDAALPLGVEFDDPALRSLALLFKGHLAWMVGNPHGVIALSGAARRDTRVFLAQHAFNGVCCIGGGQDQVLAG